MIGEVALQKLRNAACELHHVDRARDLALRVGKYFAVFGGNRSRERVFVLIHQLQKFENDAGAANGRRVGPRGERGRSGLHGSVNFGFVCERNFASDGSRGGVVNLLEATRVTVHGFTADIVADVGVGEMRGEVTHDGFRNCVVCCDVAGGLQARC